MILRKTDQPRWVTVFTRNGNNWDISTTAKLIPFWWIFSKPPPNINYPCHKPPAISNTSIDHFHMPVRKHLHWAKLILLIKVQWWCSLNITDTKIPNDIVWRRVINYTIFVAVLLLPCGSLICHRINVNWFVRSNASVNFALGKNVRNIIIRKKKQQNNKDEVKKKIGRK